MLTYPRGHFSVSRPLADFDAKFGAGVIVRTIEARRQANAPVRVLEIGCGEGRVLMQLRRAFPDAELHGVNRRPWDLMQGSQSLPQMAVHYGIYAPHEMAGVVLPAIHFFDAEAIPFIPGCLDVVISQVAIPYVARKDRLLSDVWRVLKPGGTAFLHLDSTRGDEVDMLGGDTPCFVLFRGTDRVPAADYFAAIRSNGFDLQYAIQPFREGSENRFRYLLVMRKNRDDPLTLGLDFDEERSFDFTRLHRSPADWGSLWGFRSLYRIRDE